MYDKERDKWIAIAKAAPKNNTDGEIEFAVRLKTVKANAKKGIEGYAAGAIKTLRVRYSKVGDYFTKIKSAKVLVSTANNYSAW